MTLSFFSKLCMGYTSISLFFFLFPSLIHKRPSLLSLYQRCLNGEHILRIAHRGGGRTAVENTLSAFEKCQKVSDMLEMDVCETKDGVLVVHHDKTLKRVCGIDKSVSQFTLEELPVIQSEVQMHFIKQTKSIAAVNQTIPTLQAVFERFPQKLMNIELKFPTKRAIQELKRLILKYNRVDTTIIGLLSPLQKDLVKDFPESNRFFSYSSLPKLVLLYMTGLLPFVPLSEKALQIPLYTQDYEGMRSRLIGGSLINTLFFSWVKTTYYLFRPMIWHLRKRGIMTYFWVCNSEEQFQKAIRGGCCGIMTDDPDLLDKFLRQRGNK